MITKKLMHDVITFCNNYIDNKNIIITITKFQKRINVAISVWILDSNGFIINCLDTINNDIYGENSFNYFKENTNNKLPKLLEQLNNNINGV